MARPRVEPWGHWWAPTYAQGAMGPALLGWALLTQASLFPTTGAPMGLANSRHGAVMGLGGH